MAIPEGFEVVSSPHQEYDIPEGFEVVEDRSALEKAGGVLDVAGTMASSIIAEPIAGLAGIAGAVLPGEQGQGARWVESTREALTRAPASDVGEEYLQATGEALQPVVEKLSAAERLLGDKTLEVTGSPELAAIAHTLPTAALEALGVVPVVKGAKAATRGAEKAAEGVAKTARATSDVVTDAAEKIFTRQSPAKQKIAQRIAEGSTDSDLAKLTLSESGKVKADPFAAEAIKQGFDDGVIAAVKQTSPADKQAMLKMVDVMEKGKKNKRFAMANRPSDVAGETLMNRVDGIVKVNREAGKNLDRVAKSLKGELVDVSSSVAGFLDNLDEMGVKLGDDLKPNFSGSDIEGITAAERAINQIVNRMKSGKSYDAYDAHRLKKFIDENVSYGKSAEGLTGKTERVLKQLRRDIDSQLDAQFPDYNDVNTTYSDTIGVIDALQDVAGKKMDLSRASSRSATGTLLRRLMGNDKSRTRLIDAIDGIDTIAKKYGVKGVGDSDLMSQVLFADELDSVFGPVARTSLQGQVEQAVKGGAQSVRGGMLDMAIDAIAKGAEKARGINEEAAFKSIRELLKQ